MKKKNTLWKKRLILIGLTSTLTATSLAACEKAKISGMNEADGEVINYVEDANNDWYIGQDLEVVTYQATDEQIKSFLAVLENASENKLYYRSLVSPEIAVEVTRDDNGQVIEMNLQTGAGLPKQNEAFSNVEIIAMEPFSLTGTLTYEEIVEIEEDLNINQRRK